MSQHITGAESLVKSLEHADVEVVFGIPGGAILPVYDPLMDSPSVRHILVRHEQGAGHAAEGYAAASNRVGVCMATSGPGATNLVTPIADAHMDSVPMVAITGQVPSAFIGSDALLAQKNGSVERKSVAIKSLDRGIPRAGMSVKNSQGEIVGEVTSGTFSPTLKHGIALALVSKEVAVGDQLVVDVRGRESQAEVVKLPFVTSHVR